MQIIRSAITVTATLILTACEPGGPEAPPAEPSSAAADTDTWVGGATCIACHSDEGKLWQDSHHDLAMQEVSAATVLGDFAGSSFLHQGVNSRFYNREGNYFVETDGPDGQLAEFPVRYVFGVYPLQQYLLELPNGKIQALSIAWDTRAAEDGGQRWFHVYGNDKIDHTDVLHWTQPSQNWETMCADCHSTNLISRYDLATDNFDTSFSEIDVSCEACHGPGAGHVEWANTPVEDRPDDPGLSPDFAAANAASWIPDPVTGISQRSPARTANPELNACAACHSRRSRIAEGNHPATPFLDTYVPALIDPPLYHADGQIRDEVYVYGSFLQSRMHSAGVTCSDCHDPHSLQLKAPGPAVCLQCHAPDRFATVEHQLHENEQVDCIDCHMPAETYMQVDVRNDHSFRIPRPDVSVAHGAPNACNQCHTDQDAAWAAEILEAGGRQADGAHWSVALPLAGPATADRTRLAAVMATDSNIPPVIRATAAARLILGDNPDSNELVNELLTNEDALVRLGAARSLQNSDPALVLKAAPTLLDDENLAVRNIAASLLAGADPVLLPGGSYKKLQAATTDFRQSQLVNAERAEAHVNLGNLDAQLGNYPEAEQAYRTAMRLNPQFVPAYVNLADLYRLTDRDNEAVPLLQDALAAAPEQAVLAHSLGLALIREDQLEEALTYLWQAAESDDATPRFALVYAIALQSTGRGEAAIEFVDRALLRFPNDVPLRRFREELSGSITD